MNTKAHFWTVCIGGNEGKCRYGPFDTFEAAGEFARKYYPFATVFEFRGQQTNSQEITREEFESLPRHPGDVLLIDPAHAPQP